MKRVRLTVSAQDLLDLYVAIYSKMGKFDPNKEVSFTLEPIDICELDNEFPDLPEKEL